MGSVVFTWLILAVPREGTVPRGFEGVASGAGLLWGTPGPESGLRELRPPYRWRSSRWGQNICIFSKLLQVVVNAASPEPANCSETLFLENQTTPQHASLHSSLVIEHLVQQMMERF